MAEIPKTARVVVIGGGVVGSSVLYHLVQKGCRDVLLLEANELTAGSTWHAAGNLPTFAGNWEIQRLQIYSASLYRQLGDITEYPINYHVTGSIRLAHDEERMEEYRLVRSRGSFIGADFELLTPAQLKQLYPFLETHGLVGGLWDPRDGDIDPAQLTQAFGRGARNGGARIVRHCPVTGLHQRASGEWEIETPQGTVLAATVVNAAGYYAPRIGQMMGRVVPSVVLEHQYMITEQIGALRERPGPLPLLRDPDESYYLRQEGGALLLGPYEHENAKARWTDGDMPADFSFGLFPDDLDRLESYIENACARVPLLATAGITKVINGPVPYTPDGNPLIGPVPGLDNAFEACGFSFGITQAGGAGKVLADWIVDGVPEWEIWSVDPRRFTAHATPEYTLAKALEVYENEYAIGFPQEERPAGRPAKTSPTYSRLEAKGAQFGARNGWERPTWFDRDGRHRDAKPTFKRPAWFEAVAAECKAVQSHAGLIDLTGFSRFEVTGEGALAWLDGLTCSRLPDPGTIGLAYFLNPQGGVLIEATLVRFSDTRFWVNTASVGEWHDRDWLVQHLPKDGSVAVANRSAAFSALSLVGPQSRRILQALVADDLGKEAFPWMAARPLVVAGVEVTVFRLNYVGELGYELHVPIDAATAVYDALHAAAPGLVDFGVYALDAMRLEKGYLSWKQDIHIEVNPFEASLDRFVRLKKERFIGRDAAIAARERPLTRRLVPLVIDATDADAAFGTTVRSGGEPVGYVTSGGFGHRVGQSIALAYLATGATGAGTRLTVDILGQARAAVVAEGPAYDPDNLLLRS